MTDDTTIFFYAEHTEDPSSWGSPRPSFDVEKFNRELEKKAGCIGSVPRFRLVWGGDKEDYLLEEMDELTGYLYRENGEEKFVSCNDLEFEFPDGAIPAPHFETVKCYTPRWIVEKWNEPLYEKAWVVESTQLISSQAGRVERMSFYREPGEFDLQLAAGERYYSETLTPEDIIRGIERDKERIARAKREAHAEVKADIQEAANKMARDGVPANFTREWFIPKEIKALPKLDKEQVSKI